MDDKQFIKELLNLEYELSRYAIKLTRCEEKAQDLLQETFLKVLSNSEKYKEDNNFRAWVYAIMKNQFINEYRREKKNNICDYLKSDYEYLNNILSITPESILTEKEILIEINKLPAKMGKPFKMYINGYSYNEIVEITEINLGTIKSRIHFARKSLIKTIKSYETVF